jgi:hypothetical protein
MFLRLSASLLIQGESNSRFLTWNSEFKSLGSGFSLPVHNITFIFLEILNRCLGITHFCYQQISLHSIDHLKISELNSSSVSGN